MWWHNPHVEILFPMFVVGAVRALADVDHILYQSRYWVMALYPSVSNNLPVQGAGLRSCYTNPSAKRKERALLSDAHQLHFHSHCNTPRPVHRDLVTAAQNKKG